VSHTRRPVVLKAYICVFVCFSTKAVHLEVVSDLTSDSFLASLWRFIARRGKAQSISSDNGINFIEAKGQLDKLYILLGKSASQGKIHHFCADQTIEWNFISECSPHFGGSLGGSCEVNQDPPEKKYWRIQAYIPLTSLNKPDDDGLQVLTPKFFFDWQTITSPP